MELNKVKKDWSIAVKRYAQAEALAFENPDEFEKYYNLYIQICRRMDYLYGKYLTLTGSNIPNENFYEGF